MEEQEQPAAIRRELPLMIWFELGPIATARKVEPFVKLKGWFLLSSVFDGMQFATACI